MEKGNVRLAFKLAAVEVTRTESVKQDVIGALDKLAADARQRMVDASLGATGCTVRRALESGDDPNMACCAYGVLLQVRDLVEAI